MPPAEAEEGGLLVRVHAMGAATPALWTGSALARAGGVTGSLPFCPRAQQLGLLPCRPCLVGLCAHNAQQGTHVACMYFLGYSILHLP